MNEIRIITLLKKKESTNHLSTDNLIGSGAFGRVYLGTLRCTVVAIKVFKKVCIFCAH